MSEAPVEELSQALFDALGRYLRAVMLRLPTEAPGAGAVTKEQWGVLVEIDKAGPAGLSMGELAAQRGMSMTSATALVDRLVNAGLVERRHDMSDRRVVRASLTPAGRRLRSAIGQARMAEYDRLLSALTAEEMDRLRAAIPALHRLAEAAGRRP